MENIQTGLSLWSSRRLTVGGKFFVFKTLVLSKMQHNSELENRAHAGINEFKEIIENNAFVPTSLNSLQICPQNTYLNFTLPANSPRAEHPYLKYKLHLPYRNSNYG